FRRVLFRSRRADRGVGHHRHVDAHGLLGPAPGGVGGLRVLLLERHEVGHPLLLGVLDQRDRDPRELGAHRGQGHQELLAGDTELLGPLLGLLDHLVGRGAEVDRGAADAGRELLRVQVLVGGGHGGVHLGHDGGDLLGGLGRGGLSQLLAGRRRGGRLDLLGAGGEQAGGEHAARSQEEATPADGASAHHEVLPRTGALFVAGHRRSSSSTASICSVRSSAAGSSAAGSSAAGAPAAEPSVSGSSETGSVSGLAPSDHTFCSRGCCGAAANSWSTSTSSPAAEEGSASSVRGAAAAAPSAAAPAATGGAASSSSVPGASSTGAVASSSRRRPPSETTSSTRPITAIVAPPA